MAYLKNRLIPAFKAKFGPRKKMVLILDNAKYHHVRGLDWVTPSTMKKTELGVYLRMARVKSITTPDGKTFPAEKFTADVHHGGPKAEDLRQVVSDYVKSHPSINTTLVKQLMDEHGYELLYTPPYESWLQPIELVWAQAKHKVARQASDKRTWQQTQEQARAALREMTPQACKNIVEHTHKLMDEWLQTAAAGSLQQHGSLDLLSRLTPEERARCSDLNLEGTALIGDAEEDKENRPVANW